MRQARSTQSSDHMYVTNQIDLATAVAVTTGQSPQILPGEALVQFAFQTTDELLQAAAEFAAGTLLVPARSFALCRTSLWRRMREVREVGGAR
jgi:hypothetical protein